MKLSEEQLRKLAERFQEGNIFFPKLVIEPIPVERSDFLDMFNWAMELFLIRHSVVPEFLGPKVSTSGSAKVVQGNAWEEALLAFDFGNPVLTQDSSGVSTDSD